MSQQSFVKKISKYALTIAMVGVIAPNIAFATEATSTPEVENDYEISSPYESVDWLNWDQYKANFHSHSTESDGSNEPAEMIEKHYELGYDVMALTDHSCLSSTMDREDDSNPDNKHKDGSEKDSLYLSPERAKEVSEGVDRDGRGLTFIPQSDEQSAGDHINTFWAEYEDVRNPEVKAIDTNAEIEDKGFAKLEEAAKKAQEAGGISHVNHPGRYTGASTTIDGGLAGEAIASNPKVIKKYTDLFEKYDSIVGMEIVNKVSDKDSYSDRIMWDHVLMNMMPERPVWGFANDDTHSIDATGYVYNKMLMPENNQKEVRKSMENGTFYAVSLVAKRELGESFRGDRLIPGPSIQNIVVKGGDEDSITISGKDYDTIEWIADGKIIATGERLDLNNYQNVISNYVRAQLKGPNGIAFTQPFGIKNLGPRKVVNPTPIPVPLPLAPAALAVGFGSDSSVEKAEYTGFYSGSYELEYKIPSYEVSCGDSNDAIVIDADVLEAGKSEGIKVFKKAKVVTVKTNGAQLLLRTVPKADSDFIALIKNGAQINLLGFTKDKKYALVEVDGMVGYVTAKCLAIK